VPLRIRVKQAAEVYKSYSVRPAAAANPGIWILGGSYTVR